VIRYSPEAEDQPTSLYGFLAEAAAPQIARDYVEAVVAHCETLRDYPMRGRTRHDLRPGLRTLPFRRRVLIAYEVDDLGVLILAISYGGRDIESLLREP
jgi:toxin ParE1/3/4